MLDSLRRVGREVEQQVSRAWENLSEGWKELLVRAGGSLTRFEPSGRGAEEGLAPGGLGWGLLAVDMVEDGDDIVVRIECPGVAREDCSITLDGSQLVIRGEKKARHVKETADWLLVERAFGRFQRVVPLPAPVDEERASASFDHGVLVVRLPRRGTQTARNIEVS